MRKQREKAVSAKWSEKVSSDNRERNWREKVE